jgi:CheY-like chemotaxis protein
MRTLRALVVDDEPDVRSILAALIRRHGFEVTEGADGEEAVRVRAERRPDAIFLDVMMPKMTGLEALERIREEDPDVPVVIVSANHDEQTAEAALRLGAVNFVHKPFDKEEIGFVVRRLRAAMDEDADVAPVADLLQERRTVLALGNEPALVAKVVAFLGRELRAHYPAHHVPATEVKLALYEAIANAIEHGNLEIGFDEKTRAVSTPEGMAGLIERRRGEAPYRDRRVRIEASYAPSEVTYRVRDGGPGFARAQIESRPFDLTALHGRGLLLIRHYMPNVAWNAEGNEITMSRPFTARHAPSAEAAPSA